MTALSLRALWCHGTCVAFLPLRHCALCFCSERLLSSLVVFLGVSSASVSGLSSPNRR